MDWAKRTGLSTRLYKRGHSSVLTKSIKRPGKVRRAFYLSEIEEYIRKKNKRGKKKTTREHIEDPPSATKRPKPQTRSQEGTQTEHSAKNPNKWTPYELPFLHVNCSPCRRTSLRDLHRTHKGRWHLFMCTWDQNSSVLKFGALYYVSPIKAMVFVKLITSKMFLFLTFRI